MKAATSSRIVLAGLLVLTLVAPAFADEPFAEVIAALGALKARQAQYEEKLVAFYLDEPLVTTGVLRFEYPDRLTKVVAGSQPMTQEIVGDEVIVTENSGETKRYALTRHPGLHGMANTLRALLAGNAQYLEKTYVIEFAGSMESWQLDLTPKEGTIEKWIKRIEAVGRGGEVGQLKVVEINGDYTLTTLHENATD